MLDRDSEIKSKIGQAKAESCISENDKTDLCNTSLSLYIRKDEMLHRNGLSLL